MARLAALGLKTGAGAVIGKVAGREDDGKAVADQAAEVLGTLRGLAAKMGQMASYVDGLVPESRRDAFEASLKVLRAQAPRSSSDAIRAVVDASSASLSTPCSLPSKTSRWRARRSGRSIAPCCTPTCTTGWPSL